MTRNVVVLAGALIAMAGCSKEEAKPDAGTEVTKVGFIYVGPTGDYGWSKSHEDGRQYLENFGTNVKTEYRESVTQADGAAKIEELYAAGCKVVFTTSFDYLQSALDAPKAHADLWTMNCSGFKTAHHAGNYMARAEEGEYLTGMVAGKMTKTNKIGVVGALRIYEQVMHINAFVLGVRAVNPQAQVLVRWVGNWFNPAMEIQAVKDLVNDGGVDVIKGLTDTNIPISISDTLKTPSGATVWALGHDNKDYCDNAKNGTCLTSNYYNWGPYYVKVVKEIVDGTYPAEGRIDYLGSSAEGLDIVGISTMSSNVPSDVQKLVNDKKAEITAGTFNVFQGPFNKADGTQWKAAGAKLSDDELICTKDFVEGVSNFDGPTCATNDDCNLNKTTAGDRDPFYDGKLTCDTTAGKCVAADLSGCSN